MEPVACPTIKQKHLAILLQGLEPVDRPQAALEQYATPAKVAAEVLFRAYGHRDVHGRDVADLGCGNGVFAVGAARLGAARVVAVDVDPQALEVARRNAAAAGVQVDFRRQDVAEFEEAVDTVFMNPPFGGQRRGADRPFLAAALRSAAVAYTFHHVATRAWVVRRVADLGGRVEERRTYKFPLPHQQPYHRKEVEEVEVDFYRIVKEAP